MKAILIDLDGTLVDSTGALFRVYLKFLQGHSSEGSLKEFQSLTGVSLTKIVAILKQKHHLTPPLQELLDQYHELIELEYWVNLPLFPGVLDFLNFAKSQKLKLALVTSAHRIHAEKCLAVHRLLELFDLIVTSTEAPGGKMNSAIYKQALTRLNLPPQQAIAVEDTIFGVMAACGAGMFTYWITHGGKPFPWDNSEGEYAFVDNWQELLQIVSASLSEPR